MLPAVEPAALLLRAESHHGTEFDVRVLAGDVRVRVVEDRVLPVPEVRTGPDEIEREGREFVHPREVRVGFVAPVVLYAEGGGGHRSGEAYGQRHRQPEGRREEHEREITGDHPAEDKQRFGVDSPAAAFRFARGLEVLAHAALDFGLKSGAVRRKFRTRVRTRRGGNGRRKCI